MIAAIRQFVTVGAGGRVLVESPELKEGRRAEVIVFVEDESPQRDKLAALDQLQKGLDLDETRTQQWIAEARAEREAFGSGK